MKRNKAKKLRIISFCILIFLSVGNTFALEQINIFLPLVIDNSAPPPTPTPTEKPGNCHPSYPDPGVCIPPPPPDLDCKDIPYRRFTVLPPDPHNIDGDGDGIGCEISRSGISYGWVPESDNIIVLHK